MTETFGRSGRWLVPYGCLRLGLPPIATAQPSAGHLARGVLPVWLMSLSLIARAFPDPFEPGTGCPTTTAPARTTRRAAPITALPSGTAASRSPTREEAPRAGPLRTRESRRPIKVVTNELCCYFK